jgi:hypothetical protein
VKLPLQFLVVFLYFVGCSSSRDGIELSQFSYNDKKYNSLIVDRVPDYGLNGTDGCVVEGQFLLSLKSIGTSEISGVVRDVQTRKPMIGAEISAWFDGQGGPKLLVTDSNGEFKITRQAGLAKIEVAFVGYRTMRIDFSRKPIV